MNVSRVRTALLCLAILLPSGISPAQARFSEAQVRAEIGDMQTYLVKAWKSILGPSFNPPKLVYYDKPRDTGCDEISPDNAFYCGSPDR